MRGALRHITYSSFIAVHHSTLDTGLWMPVSLWPMADVRPSGFFQEGRRSSKGAQVGITRCLPVTVDQ